RRRPVTRPRGTSMSSTRAEESSPLVRLTTGVALALALALVAGGCSGSPSSEEPEGVAPRAGQAVPIPPDLASAFTETLDARAESLRDRDRERFLTTILRGNRGFVTAQSGYFDN